MSAFTPRRINQDNNITPRGPIKELLWLLTGIVAIIGAAYIVLGFVLESAVTSMPPEREEWIYETLYAGDFDEALKYNNQKSKFASIIKSLPDNIKPGDYNISLHVVESDDINAFAYPGGRIILTSALLDSGMSDNAVLFIIGHEMGHIKNRDHLRGLGRGLAAMVIAGVVAGQDSGAVNVISSFLNLTDMSFSRAGERRADIHGVETLIAHYGHAGGAMDFFELIKEKHAFTEKIPSFLKTHPGSDERIRRLKSYIADQGYAVD